MMDIVHHPNVVVNRRSFFPQQRNVSLESPFVLYYSTSEEDRRLYFLQDGSGEQQLIGFSHGFEGTENVHFRVWQPFSAKYSNVLSLGNVYCWDVPEEFEMWMHRIIYESFACLSTTNNDLPWFIRTIGNNGVDTFKLPPQGYEDMYGKWVLLRSGWKCYPVFIARERTINGWSNFCADHKLQSGCRLIFGAERKWIFDVIVLNDEFKRMEYHWTRHVGNLVYVTTSHVLRTSFLPSVIMRGTYLVESGFVYKGLKSYNEELARCFNVFLEDDNVTAIHMVSGRTIYIIGKIGKDLDTRMLTRVKNDLDLHDGDFLYLAAVNPNEIRVIVFGTNGIERLYPWGYYVE